MPHASGIAGRRPRAFLATLGLVLTTGGTTVAADATPDAKPAKQAAATAPIAPSEAIKEMVQGENVREFRAFCDSWMAKLQERTSHNTAHIAWAKGDVGVVGEYVSYGTERTCVAREEPGKDPIGKITYREIKYRKEGPTESAAMGAAGTIVEQTDVTEIFRYAKGRWQY